MGVSICLMNIKIDEEIPLSITPETDIIIMLELSVNFSDIFL